MCVCLHSFSCSSLVSRIVFITLLALIGIFIGMDTIKQPKRLISIAGMGMYILICYLCSKHRKRVRYFLVSCLRVYYFQTLQNLLQMVNVTEILWSLNGDFMIEPGFAVSEPTLKQTANWGFTNIFVSHNRWRSFSKGLGTIDKRRK